MKKFIKNTTLLSGLLVAGCFFQATALVVELRPKEIQAIGDISLTLTQPLEEAFSTAGSIETLDPVLEHYTKTLDNAKKSGNPLYRLSSIADDIELQLPNTEHIVPAANGKQLLVIIMLKCITLAMNTMKKSLAYARVLADMGLFDNPSYFAAANNMDAFFTNQRNCDLFIAALQAATPGETADDFRSFFTPSTTAELSHNLHAWFQAEDEVATAISTSKASTSEPIEHEIKIREDQTPEPTPTAPTRSIFNPLRWIWGK